MSLLRPILDCTAALALACCSIYCSYALARRLIGPSPASIRGCAAGVVWLWTLTATFHALASVHSFTLGSALAISAVAAILIHLFVDDGKSPRMLRRDLIVLAAAVRRAARTPGRPVYLGASVLLILALPRALLLPPLAWDSLTYHLFIAGKWVQEAGTFSLLAPDAWSYYRYFPANGEILSAWFMLPFHGDAVVGLVNVAAVLLAMLAFYSLGRLLGIGRAAATLGSVLLGFTPAVFGHATSCYVELPLLAELLLGSLFLLRAAHAGRERYIGLLLASAAFGCALGTKLTAVAVFAPAVCVAVAAIWRDRRRPAAMGMAALGIVLLAVVSMPWYARAWMEQGSATYPFSLSVGDLTLSAGSPTLERLLRDKAAVARERISGRFGEILILQRLLLPLPSALGPLLVIALVAAPAGLRACWRRKLRLPILFLLSAAALSVAGYFSPAMEGVRLYWADSGARFLAFPYAVALLLAMGACELPGLQGLRRWLVAAGLLNLALLVPFGLLRTGWPAVVVAAAAALIFSLGRYLLSRRIATWKPAFAVLLIAVAALPAALQIGRAAIREPYFRRGYDVHDLPHYGAGAWTVCDRPEQPRRIAFSAGWDSRGHNWYWYPLLGRRLQNSVTYIPVSEDGRIVNYEDSTVLPQEASFNAWLGRLIEQQIDVLVCFPPETTEYGWALEHPEVFDRDQRVANTAVFHVRRNAARKLCALGNRDRPASRPLAPLSSGSLGQLRVLPREQVGSVGATMSDDASADRDGPSEGRAGPPRASIGVTDRRERK